MFYKLEFRPLASLEIFEAYDWYELQREGLGLEFLEELEEFYKNLFLNPHIYSYYNAPVREGKISRFPYIVVYEVIETSIVIYSVFMSSRNPIEKRTE